MSNLPFRDKTKAPVRRYSGTVYKDYRRYKTHLRKDFQERCGYTNCHDEWFGGPSNFQIDHFLPQSKNPELKTTYSNLVYCCSYVNRAKSNDENEYLDPCDVDYNEHFYRTSKGEIRPVETSKVAIHMYKKMKLYLIRYSIIWTLERLEKSMNILDSIIKKNGSEEAKELLVKVTSAYLDYKNYLRAQYS